jgi:hypothetical protein
MQLLMSRHNLKIINIRKVIALLSKKMTGYFLLAWLGGSNLILPLGLLIGWQPVHPLQSAMQTAQPRQSQSRPEPVEERLAVNKHRSNSGPIKKTETTIPTAVPIVKTPAVKLQPVVPEWQQIRTIKTTTPAVVATARTKPAAAKLSNYQFQMLARIISAEAKGEPFHGQVAVGAVILNRVASGRFPKTIAANVLKRGQFEPVANGAIWEEPTASAYRAASLALKGWDPTRGALYFFNPAKSSSRWIWSRPIIARIGDHVFAV